MNLPIVSNCDNCGACCREQESPPMYLYLLSMMDRQELSIGDDEWNDDATRVLLLPMKLKKELRDYVARLRRGEGHPNNGVCIWFDETTLRCRHYELRPDICRNSLNPGDEGCIGWRREYGVGSIDEVPTEMFELLGDLGDIE